MQQYPYVILGGGMAAGYAAQELANYDLEENELLILSADDHPPYERPPLSKAYLAGKKKIDDVLINSPDFYSGKGIDLRLQTEVTQVDLPGRRLTTRDGESFGYKKLLIATGSRLRKFDVPGADAPEIYYLRTLDDSTRIRERSAKAHSAVVIGSGFIGMEVASVLAERDLEVTLLFPEQRVWQRFFTPEMSGFFEKYYLNHGVHLRRACSVTGFRQGKNELVIELDSGEKIAADFAVAGIGVEPAVELFQGSPLKIDKGIVVNEFLETNQEGVYAAGDVANWRDKIFGKQRHIEHWDNAVTQGAHAARVMMGEREPYIHVPYFFSDEFDLSYEFWGDTEGADEIIHRGDVAGGHFSTWWIRGGRLVAAFILDRPDEERNLAQRLIADKEAAPTELLRDDSLPLAA